MSENTTSTSQGWKKVLKVIFDFLGVFVPCITFLVIFVSFMIGILARYFWRVGVPWVNEVAILGYMWTMFFGCGKAIENDEHVVFSLVYDLMKPIGQLICKVVYNAAIVVLLAIVFKPCLTNLLKASNVTPSLKIPYVVAFAPFMYMLAETIVRSAINIWKAFKEYNMKKGGATK